MKLYLFIIIVFIISSCNHSERKASYRKEIPFQETGLKVACTRAIKTLDNDIDGIHFIDNQGNHIKNDSVNNLLYNISLLDNFTKENSKKYKQELFEVFKKKDTTENLYKISIASFLMDVPANLSNEKSTITKMLLQDFDLYLKGNKKISVRILNDYDIIKITIDSTIIFRSAENIPL